jgi:hypothetical protein
VSSILRCNASNSSIPLTDLLEIHESGNDNKKDLQNHKKEVIPSMFSESAPVLSSVETKDHTSEKAQYTDRKHRPRSVSRNRDPKEPRRSAATRDGSLPRAGGKIKLVRSNSGRNTEEGSSICTDEDKSRKSASEKSTKLSQSRSSRSSCRSAPRRCESSALNPPCPKGPPPRSHSAKTSLQGHPECLGSPTGRGGTPRRKIKYVKNAESLLLANESFGKLEF